MKPEQLLEGPQFLTGTMQAVESGEGRLREVVFYSGAKVERYDWYSDTFYDLSFDLNSVDLADLNAGAPVLNSHNSDRIEDQVGKVTRGWVEQGRGVASLLFSERDEVAGIWKDIEDGIISSVSMGTKVSKYELIEENTDTKRKHFLATAWRPFEISLVPRGADPGARFLAADPRLERLRMTSAKAGEPRPAEMDAASYALALKRRRARVLGGI